MSKKCGVVKNPCKICFDKVDKKTGLQCLGACRKWVHFSCLNYTPGKVQDIQKGFIKILCPCPGCEGKLIMNDNACNETCKNACCPMNDPQQLCNFKDCSSNTGQHTPCPNCPHPPPCPPPPPCAQPPPCAPPPTCQPPPKCPHSPTCPPSPTCHPPPKCLPPPKCPPPPPCAQPPPCAPPPTCQPPPKCPHSPTCPPSPTCHPPPKCSRPPTCPPTPTCPPSPKCHPPPKCPHPPTCPPPPTCHPPPKCPPPPTCPPSPTCPPRSAESCKARAMCSAKPSSTALPSSFWNSTRADKDIQICPPKKSHSCTCAMLGPNGLQKQRSINRRQGSNHRGMINGTMSGSNCKADDKIIQSCPSQRSQSCTCAMINCLDEEPMCELQPLTSDDTMRGTLAQLGATVGQLAAQVEVLMTQINQPT